ncbi:MAG: sugar transferase [Actinomycetota bacterium]|nr:sugar transferase [Actinomycetota bacterium]
MSTRTPVKVPGARWESGYRTAVLLTDLVLIAVSLRVGLVITDGNLAGHRPGMLAAMTATVLLGSLFACRVWEQRVLGQGVEEFRRLGNGVLVAAVVLGLTALAIDVGVFRPWVFGVIPATGLCLLISRCALRRVLHARRRRGLSMHSVLVAGSLDEVVDLIERTRRECHYGWSVSGVCIPGATTADRPREVHGVPVVGGLGDVSELVLRGGYRVVAVVPDAHWTRRRLRELAWDLEGAPAELVVAPALMEVTGPRLHVEPVYWLTLLRVSHPTFTGPRWVFKGMLDRISACLALVLLAPLLLGVALAIKLEDGGPVFFRQQRVGKAGRLFQMVKFRSDPRATRIGAVLRRYSLDELPQLVNVVAGDMSIVGPRPPLPAEAEHHGVDARRRLLVKPGLTGLWQISGRSDLSSEEAVLLGLRYVENWSFVMDLVIIWKTAGAVLRGNGAY